MCDDWLDKDSGRYEFIEWALHNGHEMGLSLDRVDTNGAYSPDNCKWSTVKEQLRNQRRNHVIEIDGERKTLTEWAEIYGVKPNTLQKRVSKYNIPILDALTTTRVNQWRHGTRQGYEKYKCRCDECREANNKRHRDRRARK